MIQQCIICKKYKGDCGHHFKDDSGHIDYDIPSEYIYIYMINMGIVFLLKRQEQNIKLHLQIY